MLFEGQNELWELGNVLKLSIWLNFSGNGHSTINSLNNKNNYVKNLHSTINHLLNKPYLRMTPFIRMIILPLKRQSDSVLNRSEGP
jgi:hypothetical protein